MPGKLVIVSQHYPPDRSTTAAIMRQIAEHLAGEQEVVVLSGWPGSERDESALAGRPAIVEIRNNITAKGALVRRAAAELAFTLRAFLALLRRLRPGDVVLTVTAPFMLPYAVVAAAWLRRARSALILHDLYPDVLVMSGLLKPSSLVAMAMRAANALMFRALDAVITIGRDAEPLLLRYRGMARDRIRFIPNWTTVAPAVRPVDPDNRYRRGHAARFFVGLSGNLGFTHDPEIVFEAARLLRDEGGIHFLLSGWGIGFERLRQFQAEAELPNVTLFERVEDGELEHFLSAADVWLIPYRKDVAGVSVPSRFYNLLAVGRSVILVSEPEAEAAMTVTDNSLGWVVRPGSAVELAEAVRAASLSADPARAERAVTVARSFAADVAMARYATLIDGLLRGE
ncbi:MAG: glycosyltransferase family 4 protein [Bradyrhizobium sp.]|uniref:glycosyltransferase family 4 protein n=1 Tax=Bradyrhizobium sp. TaxID=376 RepID=UPI001DDDB264|nr:glycosyltransferase family 4 protein [Bradyrhizobium sp.]MBV9563238.1 glycosyltransferase family 4 protein [Bradyrhizobium sp.]